jgi:hypothetical protein
VALAPPTKSEITGHATRRKTDMSKAQQIHKTTARPKSETNELATRKKVQPISRKQTALIRRRIKTHLEYGFELWGPAPNSSVPNERFSGLY